jgi:hypothetical protein|tara:strand:- start:47 stop:478 length:432 start_codon:yes stop_codon:yes gene_type:complete
MKLPPTEKPLTIKQERFAQLVIEKQGRLSEAYREAYDADNMTDESVKVTAHRLAREHEGVAKRVDELRSELLERHRTSVDTITAELEEARRLAMTEKAAGPAVQASMGKAKLHGLLVEKREVTTPQGVTFVMTPPDAEKKAGD